MTPFFRSYLPHEIAAQVYGQRVLSYARGSLRTYGHHGRRAQVLPDRPRVVAETPVDRRPDVAKVPAALA